MCVYCIKYQDINLQLTKYQKQTTYIFFIFSAQCNHFGKPYSHGAIFKPKKCVTCQCLDGHVNCSRKDPIQDCPVLDCPVQDQVLEEGQCCPTCKLDFCSRGHDCHPELANCVNGLQNYTCHCKHGFKGNGTHCEGKLAIQIVVNAEMIKTKLRALKDFAGMANIANAIRIIINCKQMSFLCLTHCYFLFLTVLTENNKSGQAILLDKRYLHRPYFYQHFLTKQRLF